MSLFSFFGGSKPAIEVSRIDDFTGRVDLGCAFRDEYLKFCQNKSGEIKPTVVAYYGESGCGKTRLLRKLDEKLKSPVKSERPEEEHFDFKALAAENPRTVIWDFKDGCDEITFLLGLKNRLLANTYGFNFPLFELGYYFYKTKVNGEEMKDPRNRQSFLDSNPTLGLVFNAANELPLVSQFSKLIALADKCVAYLKEVNDKRERNVNELVRKIDEPDVDIAKYLKELFICDMERNVADQVNKKGEIVETRSPMVIFLDSYELLASEFDNSLQNDLWLRSSNPISKGLIFALPKVFWVIASKNPLKWNNDSNWTDDNLHQYAVKPFSAEESANYIGRKMSAFQCTMEPDLAEDLFKLTKGSPAYLKSCCDLYKLLLEQDPNRTFTIDDFGRDNDQLVENFIKPLPVAVRQILYVLAWLRQWNDSLIESIGDKVLHNFSLRNYVEIKSLSFITENESGYAIDANIRNTLCKNMAKQSYCDGVLERLYDVLMAQATELKLDTNYCLNFKLRSLPQIVENQKDYPLTSVVALTRRLESIQVLYEAQMSRDALPIAENFLQDLVSEQFPTKDILDTVEKVGDLLDGLCERSGNLPKRESIRRLLVEYYGSLLKRKDLPLVSALDVKIKILKDLKYLYYGLSQDDLAQKQNKLIYAHLKKKRGAFVDAKMLVSIDGAQLCMELVDVCRLIEAKDTQECYDETVALLDELYEKHVSLLGRGHEKTLLVQRMKIETFKKSPSADGPDYVSAYAELLNMLDYYRIVYGDNSKEVESLYKEMIDVCYRSREYDSEESMIMRLYKNQSLYWPCDSVARLEKIEEFLKHYGHRSTLVRECVGEDAAIWREKLPSENSGDVVEESAKSKDALEREELSANEKIAFDLKKEEKFVELLEFCQQIYANYVEQYSENNVKTMMAKCKVSDALCLLGRYDEALELHKSILEYAEHYLKNENPGAYAEAVDGMLDVFCGLKRHDDLVDLFVTHAFDCRHRIWKWTPLDILDLCPPSRRSKFRLFLEKEAKNGKFENPAFAKTLEEMNLQEGRSKA